MHCLIAIVFILLTCFANVFGFIFFGQREGGCGDADGFFNRYLMVDKLKNDILSKMHV